MLQAIAAYVEKDLAEDKTGHDFQHICRVVNLTARLADSEALSMAEREQALIMAYLHDSLDDKIFSNIDQKKVQIADWLGQLGMDDESIKHVLYVITHLSFKANLAHKHHLPLAGQIVQDADRLDALGAVGIARACYYGGAKGQSLYDEEAPRSQEHLQAENYRQNTSSVINHFYEKLLHLESLMNTPSGRQIARQRTGFMEEFLAQFYAEVDAKDL